MNQASLALKVERAREGDSEAWGEVYRDLSPLVFRLCRRILPTREDAEDATGEIFLKAHIHLDQYDAARPFKAWLYRVSANHCWDELRKRRSRKEIEAGELEIATAESKDPGPDERLLEKQTREGVRAALAELGDQARMAVAMRYFAEMSYEEIADVLEVTSSFVGVLLLRARHKLRRILSGAEKR
jgi:RNA polymerase sigma-70 factor (ECF subfamily)